MHIFWNKELVLHDTDGTILSKPIKVLSDSDYSPHPIPLPNLFEWCALNLSRDSDLCDLYNLLSNHYLEEQDEIYRAIYSKDLLQWSLMPPNYKSSWHLGIRIKTTKKLVAFISAIPVNISLYQEEQKMVEINYLCIHKKLRNKRLAPILIKEISRRAARNHYFHAIYTAGKHYQQELSKMCYFHRSLNVQKLIDIGFQNIRPKMTMKMMKRLYSLPQKPLLNIQLLDIQNLVPAFDFFKKHIVKYQVYPIMTFEEFTHWFLPKKDIIYTYIVKDGDTITDLSSFYSLTSRVIKHTSKHKEFKTAFSFYNISTTSQKDLMHDILILAKSQSFDIYTCLDIMNHDNIFQELKFGKAMGQLYLYMYNWQAPVLKPSDVGIVMI